MLVFLRRTLSRLSPAAELALPELMAPLVAARGWSNGRTLDTLARNLFSVVADRRHMHRDGAGSEDVEIGDLTCAIAELGLVDAETAGASAVGGAEPLGGSLRRARMGAGAPPVCSPAPIRAVAGPVSQDPEAPAQSDAPCVSLTDPKVSDVCQMANNSRSTYLSLCISVL